MNIIYKHGDLMASPETFIVQGCNAQGVMGSGVAKLLRDADETIYSEYRQVYEDQGNFLKQGQCVWVFSKVLNKFVINAITQRFYGREPGVVYADYDAIEQAFRDINDHFYKHRNENATIPQVAMPLIGAGLAQGKWSIIAQTIEESAEHFQPVVYLMDGIIPDGVQGEVINA
jgi:O-acetyl-ADP-ribose deacetylase (regulator of RNase III)